ncbi:MAG: transglutaminase family protein [Lachnospiraceae bacterium]
MSKLKANYSSLAAGFLFPAIIFTGIGGFLIEIAGSNACLAVVAAAGIAAIIITQIAAELQREKRTKAAMAGAAFLTAYVLITFVYFKAGIAAVLNNVLQCLKEVRPYNYVEFYVGDVGEKAAETVFLSWLAITTGAAVVMWLRKRSKAPLVAVFSLWIVTNILFGSFVSLFWTAASSAALAMWMLHIMIYKGMNTYKDVLQGDMAVMIRTMCITFVLTLFFAVIAPGAECEKPQMLQNAKEYVSYSIEQLRYGGSDTGLTEGRLYNAGALERSDTMMLRVILEKPDSYYLKGFVGETYKNSGWYSLEDRSVCEAADMFYWLHADGFYGYNQIFNASSVSEKNDSFAITIENLGADRKYIYTPYELSDGGELTDMREIGDRDIEAKGLWGKKKYSFRVVPNQIKKYKSIGAGLVSSGEEAADYIRNESYYNKYVYSNYTEVPQEIAAVLSKYLGDYILEGGQSHFDYQMAKQNIIFFMTEKMEYSEEAEPTGRDVDFILNFIEGTKRGYDIHFASAAVMMFRYYGIPARYVEGYLITREDIEGEEDAGMLELDGSHAHAWVEYYQDGVGWLPFEVTPTYLDIMENPDTFEDISGLIGQTETQDREITEEEPEEPQTEDGIQSFLIKYRMIIILAVLSMLVTILATMFIIWIVKERRRTAARINSFDDDDVSEGICNIFDYTLDLLTAWGMKPEKGFLMNQSGEIERLLGKNKREKYSEVVNIRQEAKYSCHKMPQEARETVRDFMAAVKDQMWEESGFFTRIKYKYMYFL